MSELEHSEWIAMVRWIARFRQEHGYCPSHREIQDAFDLSSLAVVHHRVSRLIEFGYITQQPGQARTIVVTRDGEQAMRIHEEQVKEAARTWQQENLRGL